MVPEEPRWNAYPASCRKQGERYADQPKFRRNPEGPSESFTGPVYIDAITTTSVPSRLRAYRVHFTPGARTAWHAHPNGQTLFVTEGVGRCQQSGGPIEIIRPGDCVISDAGEYHWHGADANRFMTHLAMQDADDEGSDVTWGEPVTDDEYDGTMAS